MYSNVNETIEGIPIIRVSCAIVENKHASK
jgi:hypothetical protein